MNKSNEKWKHKIQKLSMQMADEYDLIPYRRTFLIKVSHNICLSLCFDFPPTAMRIRVAAQPLYISERVPNLSFGHDIKRPNFLKMGYWGSNPNRYEEDIAEIKQQIIADAIPFFGKISSPAKLIDFLKNKESMNVAYVICPPSIRNTYLAYSYLYLKEYHLAIDYLENIISILSEYSDKNSISSNENASTLLSLIHTHEFAEIDHILNNNILQFRSNCGI